MNEIGGMDDLLEGEDEELTEADMKVPTSYNLNKTGPSFVKTIEGLGSGLGR